MAVAGHLVTDPEGTKQAARTHLENISAGSSRRRGGKWHDRWISLLDGPLDDLLTALTADTVASRELRRNFPFIGVLTRCRADRRTGCDRTPTRGGSMRREELEHLLRAASRIAERRDVLVLGSQAILGTYDEDELPEAATMSIEADLAFMGDEDQAIADRVDGILGEDSQFHRTHGFYGQGVAVAVAILPDG
jgi:hypothetical protein